MSSLFYSFAVGGAALIMLSVILWAAAVQYTKIRRESVSRIIGSFMVVGILSLAAGFGGLLFVPGHIGIAENPSAPEMSLSGSRIELHFRNAPVHVVLMSCARQVGAVLALDKNLQGSFSIDTSGQLRDVMDEICEAFSCTWEMIPGKPPALLVKLRENSPKGAARSSASTPAPSPSPLR